MDNLQYFTKEEIQEFLNPESFKPYYKWITFNTYEITLGCLIGFVF